MPWHGKKSAGKTKKRSAVIKQRTFSPERLILWIKHAGLTIAVLVFVGWLGAWFIMSGTSVRLTQWGEAKFLTITANAGLKVNNIMVEGRHFTDPDMLMAIANVGKGDPLFAFDPNAAKQMMEKISWVKNAQVERRFPDTVYISLEERQPMALWQRNKRLSLIDGEGVILTDDHLERFKDLVIVVGENVPAQAPEFLKLLKAEPLLWQRTEAAMNVSGRRWDIKLKNGVVLKLPEEEMSLALRRLAVMQEEDGLMDKDVETIDMRQPERVTIKTKPGAVQEYKANFTSSSDPQNAI